MLLQVVHAFVLSKQNHSGPHLASRFPTHRTAAVPQWQQWETFAMTLCRRLGTAAHRRVSKPELGGHRALRRWRPKTEAGTSGRKRRCATGHKRLRMQRVGMLRGLFFHPRKRKWISGKCICGVHCSGSGLFRVCTYVLINGICIIIDVSVVVIFVLLLVVAFGSDRAILPEMRGWLHGLSVIFKTKSLVWTNAHAPTKKDPEVRIASL